MVDGDYPIRETTPESNPFVSPMTETGPPAREDGFPANRGLGWLLFSSRGRIPRRIIWAVWGGMFAAVLVLEIFVLILTAGFFGDENPPAAVVGLLVGVLIIFSIAFAWVNLLVQLKRWHDRDKPVWWLFINLVPGAGWLWVLIELGCLRGTKGPNRYGPDPA
jgi:uncharacterized membrane protein YhaH (DUF805 family)